MALRVYEGAAQHRGRRPRNVDDGVVRIQRTEARSLVDAYRRAGGELWDANLALAPLLQTAGDVLNQAVAAPPFAEIGLELGRDADDLEGRVDFLEQTDGFDLAVSHLDSRSPKRDWPEHDAYRLSLDELAVLLASAKSAEEIAELVAWMHETHAFDHAGFDNAGYVSRRIDARYRHVFATAIAMALANGWVPEGDIPSWLAAGVMTYGDPNDEVVLILAERALIDRDRLDNSALPNPFEVSAATGLFGPFAERFANDPPLARLFITRLLDIHDETGDTPLNRHDDGTPRNQQLATLVLAASSHGSVEEREAFVDRLVRTINADGDTNDDVFWATWAAHADLVLHHEVVTTEPTFGTHHWMPDAVRPSWERLWNERVSPVVLETAFTEGHELKSNASQAWQLYTATNVPLSLWTRYKEMTAAPEAVQTGNDPGGTYTTRAKVDFHGTRFHFSAADRGRNIINHALEDGSDRGDIAQDEFAIIDHGIGANGKPTYTINLPGVIDLSNPVPGFDPVHRTVRDMDQAALRSATSAQVEDNLYAQMVIRALRVNEIEQGANLMIVGHSFGADTAADLAASAEFSYRYNITHVVAAAYDSVPQLAHIDPSIDVLVLQNEDDKAITLEATQRAAAASFESVSVNTFAHEVREFDGGWGLDIGHHQDRYIAYLNETNDSEITRFYESVAAVGYGEPGTSVAIDVTLDESLLG